MIQGLHIDPLTEEAKHAVEDKLALEELEKDIIKMAKNNWTSVAVAMKIVEVELTDEQEADIKDHFYEQARAYKTGEKKTTASGRVMKF